MTRSLFLGCLLFSSFALAADSATRAFRGAADAVEDAFERTKRGTPACRQTIGTQLDALVDQVDDLKKGSSDQGLTALKLQLSSVGMSASMVGCPVEVNDDLHKAVELLEEGRVAMWGNTGRGGQDDRRNRRHGNDPRFTDTANFVQLAPLQIQTEARFDGERAVRVSLPELKLFNLQGAQFYVGARFRSYEGEWSEWVTTQTWSVPTNAFTWKNAFNHFFRYSTLAEDDFSNGRFIAHVSIFDASGHELAFREAMFRVRLPQLPQRPPVMGPPPTMPGRDCGTGSDPGCLMWRSGQYPMDATVFAGVMQSLRSTNNEMLQGRTVEAVLASNSLTALQLSPILDLFGNEIFKLRVAEMAAPRVVNPQHALGFATKFRNSMFGQAYTQVMLKQPQGGMPGMQPPPVVVPTPNYPPQPPPGVVIAPPPGYRDCGTGNDPGCTMTRNGQGAMDATTFAGVMTALRSNTNELTRADLCNSLFNANYLTALQFGQVLDLFSNELTRLDVARKASDHLVNPQHAIGFAAKFRNSFNAQDFVQVMTGQRGR